MLSGQVTLLPSDTANFPLLVLPIPPPSGSLVGSVHLLDTYTYTQPPTLSSPNILDLLFLGLLQSDYFIYHVLIFT